MTTILCFVSGDNSEMWPEHGGWHFYTAQAITDQGRWIAGANSTDRAMALERVVTMAKRKGPEMLSGQFTVTVVEPNDERLYKALNEAFRRQP